MKEAIMDKQINDKIVEGRRFRQFNEKTNTWKTFCGWHVTDKPFKKSYSP